jgi:hypothetical protein
MVTKLTKTTICPHLQQTGVLGNLPNNILISIATATLGDLHLPSIQDMLDPSADLPVLDKSTIKDLFALLHTCRSLYHLDLPSQLWTTIILSSLHDYRLLLLTCWRANPRGVGSASNLLKTVDHEFAEPLKQAMRDTWGIEHVSGVETVTMQDVWRWWMYSDGWRSRRRVWYCVVYGCAVARNSERW